MTTSERAPQTAADADARETAPIEGTVATPQKDPRQLEQEIERTREQLGETVQELVARVDVKSRAQAKANEISGRVKSQTVQAREAVWGSRERWMPFAAAAGVMVVGFASLWEWSRRGRAARLGTY
jgi:Protein of unknown function (DUF3618)